MSILVGKDTTLIIQGATGKSGQVHVKRYLDAGYKIRAGVTPGKGGQQVHGIPIYDSVADAVKAHPDVNSTLILTPPSAVRSAAMEAVNAGVALIVISTEWVPVNDTLDIVTSARKKGLRVVGPNTVGVISPGQGMCGIMPINIYGPSGHVGLVSRSGTLTHENSSNLYFAGYGLSTCVGIGGDPIRGMNHKEVLELFRDDEQTKLVVMIGEIGGGSEEEAAKYIKETNYPKPVVAFIAGTQAPEGKNMGHAGAIVSGGLGSAKAKAQILADAGVRVARTIGEIVELVAEEDAKLGYVLKTCEPIVNTHI